MNSLCQGGLPVDVAEAIAWLADPGSTASRVSVAGLRPEPARSLTTCRRGPCRRCRCGRASIASSRRRSPLLAGRWAWRRVDQEGRDLPALTSRDRAGDPRRHLRPTRGLASARQTCRPPIRTRSRSRSTWRSSPTAFRSPRSAPCTWRTRSPSTATRLPTSRRLGGRPHLRAHPSVFDLVTTGPAVARRCGSRRRSTC